MSITFKKILRKSPLDKKSEGLYYPQIITWGKPVTLEYIAGQMKDKSSLTHGDIKSVITNFVEAMRKELFNGHAVNIENFGVFSLSATTKGTKEKKDCLPENIKAVRINFRASTAIRPTMSATRSEDRMDFVDLEQQLKKQEGGGESPNPNPDEGGGDSPDPM